MRAPKGLRSNAVRPGRRQQDGLVGRLARRPPFLAKDGWAYEARGSRYVQNGREAGRRERKRMLADRRLDPVPLQLAEGAG